jgi:RNase P subunit RPR2
MNNFLACTICHEVVLKGIGEEIKVRAKVILVRKGHTYAVCKGCGSELEVPFRFDLDLAKSLAQTDPRLYLKK